MATDGKQQDGLGLAVASGLLVESGWLGLSGMVWRAMSLPRAGRHALDAASGDAFQLRISKRRA